MAVTFQCSRCSHEQKIDDEKIGKEVPCKICHHPIKTGGATAKKQSKLAKDKADAEKSEGIQPGAPKGSNGKPTAVTAKKPPKIDEPEPAKQRKRRPDDDDDEDDDQPRSRSGRRRDKQGSSSGVMMVVLGIGAFVLLGLFCGGAVVGAFLAFDEEAAPQPIAEAPPVIVADPPVIVQPRPFPQPRPPIIVPQPPFPQPPQAEVLDPNNAAHVDRVLTLLKGPAPDRGPAYNWLRDARTDHPRRIEIAAALDTAVNDHLNLREPFGNDNLFNPYFRWAGKANIATLIRVVEDASEGHRYPGYRHEAMKMLASFKDAKAAPAIAKRLANFRDGDHPTRALIDMGSVAEPVVLGYFNHPDGRTRNEARKVIQAYNTTSEKIVAQVITDLDSTDNNRRNAAVQWLATSPVNAQKRSEVARALNKSIPKANFFFEKDLAKVLSEWGTSENVPTLIQRLEGNKGGGGNDDVIRILGKIGDPQGVKAIARSMSNFFNDRPARLVLKELSPDIAEPAVIEALNATTDGQTRNRYVSCLGEIGTRGRSLVVLQQLAARNPQDFFLNNAIKQAATSIVQRGK